MKKLLIIENDLDILDLIEIIFEGKFQIKEFQRKIAIEEIIKINPNIIIIDYLLDEGFGSELCLEIKSNPLSEHFPVILFSAFNNIKQLAEENCADDFIAKPFDIEYLEEIVNKRAL
jgi:two-component system, OmpR family, phosphate regulon response regulator PhoB